MLIQIALRLQPDEWFKNARFVSVRYSRPIIDNVDLNMSRRGAVNGDGDFLAVGDGVFDQIIENPLDVRDRTDNRQMLFASIGYVMTKVGKFVCDSLKHAVEIKGASPCILFLSA